ncbi:unnamed protein product [Vitrella brassicaformis CCMP3155]|uniref:Peptidase M16 N-terminal domain-containing protein n=3 Tax=Vitrella brassicaformis TaxID=1169539 RepID=A0A0G4EYN1_VITBC|nr:unnamed protein product [Vitrella brassicaformis CCMP3155]|eukprot:CEM03565.1 unnamed protein product [Vitrella brassicaformis CCMP3155]
MQPSARLLLGALLSAVTLTSAGAAHDLKAPLQPFLSHQRSAYGHLHKDNVTSAERPSGGIVRRVDEMDKPGGDSREYRTITLKNQLEAVLASDMNEEFGTMALRVKAGSFQDPDELPGLAHLLEHLVHHLSVPTDKHPYSVYKHLSIIGGDNDAFTVAEGTFFQFQVPKKHMQDALKRFADMFIMKEHVFTDETIKSEITAVNNDFNAFLQNEKWRVPHMTKVAANHQHPHSRFDPGNRASLDKGISKVRKALVGFFNQFYSANAIKLSLIGPFPLDKLQKWVVQYFSPIPNRQIPLTHSYPVTPYEFGTLGIRYDVVPALKDVNRMLLYFPYTPEGIVVPGAPPRNFKESKPEQYILSLINYRGPGSLSRVLIERGWATRLEAKLTEESGDLCEASDDLAAFKIEIRLTRNFCEASGERAVDSELELFFHFLHLMRREGSDLERFTTLANEKRAQWDEAPGDDAEKIVESLFHFPPPRTMSGPSLLDKWSPEDISFMLDRVLTPDNIIAIVASKTLFSEKSRTQKQWKTEQWYKIVYRGTNISSELKARWRSPPAVDKRLKLPGPNPFTAGEMVKIKGKGEGDTSPKRSLYKLTHRFVELIVQRSYYDVSGAVLVVLTLPELGSGSREQFMVDLYIKLITDRMDETTYMASKTGIDSSIEFDMVENHILIKFSRIAGQNIQRLLQSYLETMKRIWEEYGSTRLSTELQERFEYVRLNTLEKKLNKQRSALAQKLAHKSMDEVLSGYSFSRHVEFLLSEATPTAIADLVGSVLARIDITVFASGNWNDKEAKRMAQLVSDVLGSDALEADEKPTRQSIQIPLGQRGVVVSRQGVSRASGFEIFLQVGHFPGKADTTMAKNVLLQQLTELVTRLAFM